MNHRLHSSLMMLALAAGASTAGAAIVIGSPVQNIAINHALTGTASASSTGYGGVASRAIDGNVNGYFGAGSTVKVEILGLNGEGTDVLSLAEVTVLGYINYRLYILDNGSEVWGMDVAPGAPGSTINIGSLFTVWEIPADSSPPATRSASPSSMIATTPRPTVKPSVT